MRKSTRAGEREEASMNGHRIAKLFVTFTVAFGTAFVAPAPPLMADSQVPDQVLAWNQHAIDELIGTQGAGALQYLAPVHGAMFDAVNAIDGGYQAYLVAPPVKSTFSKDAAAA